MSHYFYFFKCKVRLLYVLEKYLFYDKCINYFALIAISIVNKLIDTWIYNLCDAATSENWQFDSVVW